jgi:hypothetical protein
MSLDDWCRLTPDELEAVLKAHVENEELRLHGDWERMRMLATITVQPHVKGRMTPEKLLPLPWENKAPVEKLSAAERKARMEAAIARSKAWQARGGERLMSGGVPEILKR